MSWRGKKGRKIKYSRTTCLKFDESSKIYKDMALTEVYVSGTEYFCCLVLECGIFTTLSAC